MKNHLWVLESIKMIIPLLTLYISYLIRKTVHHIHIEFNSKMDAFIREIRKQEYAAGKLEGEKHEF